MKKVLFSLCAILFAQTATAGCAEGRSYPAYHIKNGKIIKLTTSIHNCTSMVNFYTSWKASKWKVEQGGELATDHLNAQIYAVNEYLVLNGKRAMVVSRPKGIAKRFMCVALPKNKKEIYCVDTQHELY